MHTKRAIPRKDYKRSPEHKSKKQQYLLAKKVGNQIVLLLGPSQGDLDFFAIR